MNKLDVDVKLLSPEKPFNKQHYLSKIENVLLEDIFELVLTDAYFLAEGHEHDDEEGTNCLEEIVKIIQDKTPLTKIVVYTNYREDLFNEYSHLDIYYCRVPAEYPQQSLSVEQ